MTDAYGIEELRAQLATVTKEREEFRSCLATTCGKLQVASLNLAARDAEVARLREALMDAQNRLKGAGMFGDDEPFVVLLPDGMPDPADHDDLQAAECIRYQQARELDK